MSKARWRRAACAALILVPVALFGFRTRETGPAQPASRVLYEGEDTAQPRQRFAGDGALGDGRRLPQASACMRLILSTGLRAFSWQRRYPVSNRHLRR